MKRCAITIFLVCVMAGVSAQPQAKTARQDALAAIDVCIAQLDAELDVGYERIAKRCPRLAHTLEQSGWAEWLPRGWKEARNDLSAGSLAELRTLVSRELGAPSGTRGPDVTHLQKVLVELGPTVQERGSLWSRFRAWLRTVVERNKQTDRRSWLDKMLRSDGRGQTIIDLTTYAALALVIALAGMIVVNEIRAADLFKSRQRARTDSPSADPSRAARISWREVEQAATADKPRLLFELVIAKLTELRRVPPAGALTVRELTRVVELTESGDRERLNDIALTAELARYSPTDVAPEAVSKVLQRGRELLTHLEAESA